MKVRFWPLRGNPQPPWQLLVASIGELRATWQWLSTLCLDHRGSMTIDQYSETIVDRRLRFAAIPQILGAWNWKQRTEINAKRTRANLANTIPNSIRRAQTNLLHYKAASLYKTHTHFTPLPSERLSGDDKPLKNGLQKFEALNL